MGGYLPAFYLPTPRPLPPAAPTLGANTAATTFPEGGASTYTTGVAYPRGVDDMKDFFLRMARRKYSLAAAATPAPSRGAMGATGAQHTRSYTLPDRGDPRPIQASPADLPPPTRLVTRYNSLPYYDLDPLHMTGAQRQIFLPQSATMGGGGGGGGGSDDALRQAMDDKLFADYAARAQQRLSTMGMQNPGEPAYS